MHESDKEIGQWMPFNRDDLPEKNEFRIPGNIDNKFYILKKRTMLRKDNNAGEYWLGNETGEGMSFSEQELFNLLDSFFKDKF